MSSSGDVKQDAAWDAFISHASEDKQFVRAVATWLERLGASTWYDEFEIRPGDSLVAMLDDGMRRSKHGVLVLSQAFLSKSWTEYERRGLTNRYVNEDFALLPVWLDVSRDEISRFSPALGDLVAIQVGHGDELETALRLLSVIRPELYEAANRRAKFDDSVNRAERVTVDLSEIRADPELRHEVLPRSLVQRIRVVHEVFLDVFPAEWEDTIQNFKRDLRPDREVAAWEHMAAAFVNINRGRELTHEERMHVFSGLLLATSGSFDQLKASDVPRGLQEEILDTLIRFEVEASAHIET